MEKFFKEPRNLVYESRYHSLTIKLTHSLEFEIVNLNISRMYRSRVKRGNKNRTVLNTNHFFANLILKQFSYATPNTARNKANYNVFYSQFQNAQFTMINFLGPFRISPFV